MIVISLTDCPPKVRGDLSKWLLEISTGGYVGNINARVRETLWKRVCENVNEGRATMVFSSNGEQRLDFAVHNTSWVPVDLDGIKLVRKPGFKKQKVDEEKNESVLKMSREEQFYHIRQIQKAHKRKQISSNYVVLDLETTGLNHQQDHIIELAAIRIEEGKEIAAYSTLVNGAELPASITKLTGITKEQLQKEGKNIKQSLKEILEFIGDSRIVSHNAAFDWRFLQFACKEQGLLTGHNPITDTLTLARRKLEDVQDYKLLTLAEYFQFDITESHRALPDCRLTQQLYEKLKEIDESDED